MKTITAITIAAILAALTLPASARVRLPDDTNCGPTGWNCR